MECVKVYVDVTAEFSKEGILTPKSFVWKDGRVYEGAFQNGKQHGVGKYTAKGITKKGVWENGTRTKWIEE